MASMEREVLHCKHCKLVQYRTSSETCRRCRKSLLPEQPKPQPVIALVPEPTPRSGPGDIQVASAVRDLRHVRNLSQRQLAGRMGVPRTYISKIENGKAMPTLSSLDRLARALQVDISALLRDAPTRHRDETAVAFAKAGAGKSTQAREASQRVIDTQDGFGLGRFVMHHRAGRALGERIGHERMPVTAITEQSHE